MNYLRRLLATLLGFFRKSPSPSQGPDNLLTRYLFSDRHFSKAKKRANATAFMPPRDGRLSLQDIQNLSNGQIWQIGHDVGLAAERRLKARADLLTSTVLATGLWVEIDEPPAGHRNIVGWSTVDSESERESFDLLRATELADAATLVPLPA